MSRPLIIYFVVNTFTTAIVSFLYTKFSQQEQMAVLLKRIEYLEENIQILQQVIENIEEDIHDKNKVIESNLALNSKLEDFINYNYHIN